MAHTRAVVVAIIIAATSLAMWWLGSHNPGAFFNPVAVANGRFAALVTEAVDGDTVRVQTARGPDTVRLLGINTPETHHPTKPVECYGPEASDFTTQALTGRRVQLELDVEHRDMYGRLLAYIVLDGKRFNDELLRRGFARVLMISPNGRYARTMVEEQLRAKRAHLGLWGAC